MKVKIGDFEKIIPEKYQPFVSDFKFTHKGKRLSPDERFELLVICVLDYFNKLKPISYQDRFAREHVIENATTDSLNVVHVYKRQTGTIWRIRVHNLEISIPGSIVNDCPKKYLIHKNEI